MVRCGCPLRTSLGITRSFPRLYPTMGLVTVALLTLPPLALRPVRLACLIHAANVHSEPGSNPSKMVRRGFAGPKADFPRIGPHPERLRKEIQSQSARSRHAPKAVPSPHSLPARAAHPAALAASGPRRPGVPGRRLARRPPSRVPHMHAKRVGSLPLASSFTCSSFSG